MARSIYREWFVNFRFPGHEKIGHVDSPLGPIPEGWEVKRLCEIADNFDRLRKPLSKMQRAEMQGEYPYYGAAKVFDFVNDYIFDGEYLLMAEDGSVVTTERMPVLQLVNEKFWPNNHTHVLRGKPPVTTHFLYLGLSLVDISPYITGAAQPKITQENMNRIFFVCGQPHVHREFDNLVSSMVHQSQILQRQTTNLQRTRDLLLSRLLSGVTIISADGFQGEFNSDKESLVEPTTAEQKHSDAKAILSRGLPRSSSSVSPSLEARRVSIGGATQEHPGNQLELGNKLPTPIDQTDRSDVLAVIRQMFSDGQPRSRDNAIRDIAQELGYERVGHRIADVLHTDLLTAVRRGILQNVGSELRLLVRSIADYEREFLKVQFLASIGRSWIERDDAIQNFCRWMGFRRTGQIIDETARSVINGLLRESRLEANGPNLIRRTS
jgi:hypothetical protein